MISNGWRRIVSIYAGVTLLLGSFSDTIAADNVFILGGGGPSDVQTGAYSAVELTDAKYFLLLQAVSDASKYASTISNPVCISSIQSIATQVVSGTNYRFNVTGCMLSTTSELIGSCGSLDCTATNLIVTVYTQTWTNTLQVTSIEA